MTTAKSVWYIGEVLTEPNETQPFHSKTSAFYWSHTHVKHSTRTREMRCCSLKMVEKNESECAQLLFLYSQFPNWLIHFQELESILGTKFLPKGCWILQVSAALKYNVAFKWGSMTWIPFNATFHGMIGVFTQFKMMQRFFLNRKTATVERNDVKATKFLESLSNGKRINFLFHS